MSLPALMTESVQILRRTVTGEDSSGNEEVIFPVLAMVDAFVARIESSESVAGRDLVIVGHSFMLPAGTDVEPYDRLVHDGRTFEVIGLPKSVVKPGGGEQFIVAKAQHMEG